MNREEFIEFLKFNRIFSLAELAEEMQISLESAKYKVFRKYKVTLGKIKKEVIVDLHKQGKSVKEIREITGASRETIYSATKRLRKQKEYKRKFDFKRKIKPRMEECNFSLRQYHKKYGDERRKVIRLLKEFDLYDWFLEEQSKRNPIHPSKYKRGEAQRKFCSLVKKYPKAIDRTAKELSVILDMSDKTVARIRKKIKERLNEKGSNERESNDVDGVCDA